MLSDAIALRYTFGKVGPVFLRLPYKVITIEGNGAREAPKNVMQIATASMGGQLNEIEDPNHA